MRLIRRDVRATILRPGARWCGAAIAAVALGLSGCSSSGGSSAGSATATAPSTRAVVLVSGVVSVTPFTTPDAACTTGYSAGLSWGPLRDYLVADGFAVYTAPITDVPGAQVPTSLDDERGPFGGCPEQPPVEVTGTSINDPQESGQKLAAFIGWLNVTYGITDVDVVAHSLGGVVSRNGIRNLKESKSPVRVRSFTTLGSPWEPLMAANPPFDAEKACDGLEVCVTINSSLLARPELAPIVKSFDPSAFGRWTDEQRGLFDGVPVTLVAGSMFTKPDGNPDKWPNDGFVQYSAALARTVPDSVLPQRACFAFPFSHSGLFSGLVGAPLADSVITSPSVMLVVANAIRTAGTPQQAPNRLGCPTP